MNLQVNFILESERRSGSTISLKFVVRVVAVVVPTVLIMTCISLFMLADSASRTVKLREQEKKKSEPKVKQVAILQTELKDTQGIQDLLDGWKASRFEWQILLTQLQISAPVHLQLIRIAADEQMGLADNVPARTLNLALRGKVKGDQSQDDVKALRVGLKFSPAMTSLVDVVEVKRFAKSEVAEEKEEVRVFEMECKFYPRKIIPPPVKSGK